MLSNQCTDPPRADKMMMEANKTNDKLTREILLRNFLQKTQARGLGSGHSGGNEYSKESDPVRIQNRKERCEPRDLAKDHEDKDR